MQVYGLNIGEPFHVARVLSRSATQPGETLASSLNRAWGRITSIPGGADGTDDAGNNGRSDGVTLTKPDGELLATGPTADPYLILAR